MKTEVISWRVSPEVKSGLEREARRRKISVSAALDLAAREWLKNGDEDDEQHQRRLHEAVAKCFGAIDGGDPYRSQNASRLVKEKLRRQYGR